MDKIPVQDYQVWVLVELLYLMYGLYSKTLLALPN